MSDNNALEQAKAQAENITAMVGARNVDYERLEELKDELESVEYDVEHADTDEEKQTAMHEIACWRNDYAEELKDLEEAANGCTDEEEAREAIQNDPLSVEVRKDWYAPGHEDDKPSEFKILLCTGGPAVQIRGELNEYGEPCRAWIEYQDWGTPWTHAVGIIEQDVLLQYCAQFYFGE